MHCSRYQCFKNRTLPAKSSLNLFFAFYSGEATGFHLSGRFTSEHPASNLHKNIIYCFLDGSPNEKMYCMQQLLPI